MSHLKQNPKNAVFRILTGLVVISLMWISGEMTIRYIGNTDPDGNFSLTLFNHHLGVKPFHLPINFVKEKIDHYYVRPSYLMYDAALGWSPRPRSSSADGLYHANKDGIRSGSIEEEIVSENNARQIVLLGDSYTHGDEVAFEHTWGYMLETKLAEMGIQATSINLGVPAYGMDQAYLRWKTSKFHKSPDLVIFGFQPENVKRNLNVFRKLYHQPADIPFSKPRFDLKGTGLHLVYYPTVPPEDIVSILSDFNRWEHHGYEFFYHPEDYEHHLWLQSRFLASGLAGIEHVWQMATTEQFYDLEQTPSRLALAIINQLRVDVEAQGGTLLIAALIPTWDFKYLTTGVALPYQDLLDVLTRDYHLVETYPRLLQQKQEGNADVFAKFHYAPAGNELIAEVLSEAIADRVSAGNDQNHP